MMGRTNLGDSLASEVGDPHCQKFIDRLNCLADRREPLEQDPQIQRHADHCQACADRLHAWMVVQSVGSSETGSSETGFVETSRSVAVRSVTRWRNLAIPLAIALSVGMLLFRFVGLPLRKDEVTQRKPSQRVVENPDPLAPSLWWEDFSNRDWLAEAMPAVQTMGESIAPIGRSLRRAFSRITIGSTDQTS